MRRHSLRRTDMDRIEPRFNAINQECSNNAAAASQLT